MVLYVNFTLFMCVFFFQVESFMEAILREIASGNEEGVKSTLKVFTDTVSARTFQEVLL